MSSENMDIQFKEEIFFIVLQFLFYQIMRQFFKKTSSVKGKETDSVLTPPHVCLISPEEVTLYVSIFATINFIMSK